MSAPDISVIIPAWKAGGFVGRAIASALASTGVSMEVVVVDDASPDETFSVLKALSDGDTRIVVDRLPANRGPSAARNRAIEMASGRFIAVLDADDSVAPDRFSHLLTLAEAQSVDIVVDNLIEVDEADQIIGDGRFLKAPEFAQPRDIDLITWIAFNQPMKPGDCLGYLKPLIRRSTLEQLGVSYDPSLRNSEDYYLVADMLARGARMIYTPTAGYRYARAAGSTSHRLKAEHTHAWLDAETRFLQRHAEHLSAPVRTALATRLRALRNVDQFVAAVDALKHRKLGAFLGLLVADVHAAGYTLATFAQIAAGKVLRRKIV